MMRTYEQMYGNEKARLLRQKLSESHKGQRKGKTYEQIYGVKKANEIKAKKRKAKLGTKIPLEKRWKLTDKNRENMSLAKRGKSTSLKGKTYVEIYGSKEQAEVEVKKRITPEKVRKTAEKNRGKKRSEETRRKISKALEGEKNYIFGKHHAEKTRQKISEGNKGKTVSKEARGQISRTHSQLIKEGKINPVTRGLSGYFYSKKNKRKLWYRSSYELQAYKILEQLSKVAKYESEPFYIPYKFQGIERNYTPDILITYDDDSQELIEVMRENMLKDRQRIAKAKAAKKYCKKDGMNFFIWTERELFHA